MLKLTLVVSLLLGITFNAYTQNIGINNPTPDASALLDLTSSTQGLLIPRMSSIDRNLIPAPATGLIVYDLTLSRFMFYNGVSWNGLLSNFVGWDVLGNAGTNSAINFLGTTDAVDLVFRTVNTERMRIDQTGDVGINTPVIDAKAAFQVTSIDRGVLLPRMTTAQRLALIANGSAVDATRDGMLLYDTNLKNFMSWNSISLRWDTILSRSSGSGLYWQLLGNTATNPAINYLGTTDSTDLVFRTNGIERFRIKANGLFYTSNQGAGASNIYMGGLAGSVTTTGSNNAGFGLGSLQNNTTGSGNSALGSFALLNNTSGSENTGVGIESLRNNTTGYGNTAVGERSGYNNTTAYGNTSIGRYSIFNNQFGLENVGVGDSVLFGSTTNVGNYNVAIGNKVLFANRGTRNVGMGYRALYNNTTGNDNVGIGTDAMFNNSTGGTNVGIGVSSLFNLTSGFRNVGVGYYAGYGLTSGDNNVAAGQYTMFNARNALSNNNVAIGYTAIFVDTLPTYNVAIGVQSLYYGNQWDQNVAIGYNALRGSTTAFDASRNVGVGYYAGLSMLDGYDNVFVGTQAGRSNTTGYNNVFIGTEAGYSNATSAENVFIGTEAGFSNNGGSNNVFIGEKAGRANTIGNYNNFIGWRAGEDNTNGFGNTIMGWWAGQNITTGSTNSIFGSLAGISNTTGAGNTYIGAAAGNAITTGGQNTFVGWVADANANRANSAAYGYFALVTANNKIRLGNAAVTVIEGQPLNYTGLSDGRFKKDLKEDVVGLDFIMKLKPVSYTFDRVEYTKFVNKKNTEVSAEMYEELSRQSTIRQSGFVAQEMDKAVQESGYASFDAVSKPEDEDDTWGIAYGTLVVPLVKSVQELNEKNQALQAQNDELMKLLESLKVRIEDLEQNMKK
jgi:hypothetical protein